MRCVLVLDIYKESLTNTMENENYQMFSAQAQYMSQQKKSKKIQQIELIYKCGIKKFG